MKCVHTETTAVLAVFGEAPQEFEQHLAECAVCRRAVSDHLETLSILAADDANPGELVHPVESERPRWNPYAASFLAAAAVLLVVQLGQQSPVTMSAPTSTQVAFTPESETFDIPLDDEIASLEMELALFNLEET